MNPKLVGMTSEFHKCATLKLVVSYLIMSAVVANLGNRMFRDRFKILLFLAFILSNITVPYAVASDGWLSGQGFKRSTKKNKRLGNYPTSIACRNKPGTKAFRPQVKTRWKKGAKIWRTRLVSNTSAERRRVNKQTMNYQGFRLKSRKSFVFGTSRQSWSCEIWYKK